MQYDSLTYKSRGSKTGQALATNILPDIEMGFSALQHMADVVQLLCYTERSLWLMLAFRLTLCASGDGAICFMNPIYSVSRYAGSG